MTASYGLAPYSPPMPVVFGFACAARLGRGICAPSVLQEYLSLLPTKVSWLLVGRVNRSRWLRGLGQLTATVTDMLVRG